MTPRQRVLRAFVQTAAYFDQTIPDDVLGWYADDLADLPPEHVVAALGALRQQPKRRTYPMPGDVRAYLQPEHAGDDGAACELAARIKGSIARFGYTNPKRAEAHIGAVGWQVVDMLGGWHQLCTTLRVDEMGTFYAQCRDLSRPLLARARTQMQQLAPPAQMRDSLSAHDPNSPRSDSNAR